MKAYAHHHVRMLLLINPNECQWQWNTNWLPYRLLWWGKKMRPCKVTKSNTCIPCSLITHYFTFEAVVFFLVFKKCTTYSLRWNHNRFTLHTYIWAIISFLQRQSRDCSWCCVSIATTIADVHCNGDDDLLLSIILQKFRIIFVSRFMHTWSVWIVLLIYCIMSW